MEQQGPTRGPLRTYNMQEPGMATLSNNKVTHTQTISNATGYSRYMWKASPTEATASVAAPLPRMPKQFYDDKFSS